MKSHEYYRSPFQDYRVGVCNGHVSQWKGKSRHYGPASGTVGNRALKYMVLFAAHWIVGNLALKHMVPFAAHWVDSWFGAVH